MKKNKNKSIEIRINRNRRYISVKLKNFLPIETFNDYRNIHVNLGFRYNREKKIMVYNHNGDGFEEFLENYIKLLKSKFKDDLEIKEFE